MSDADAPYPRRHAAAAAALALLAAGRQEAVQAAEEWLADQLASTEAAPPDNTTEAA